MPNSFEKPGSGPENSGEGGEQLKDTIGKSVRGLFDKLMVDQANYYTDFTQETVKGVLEKAGIDTSGLEIEVSGEESEDLTDPDYKNQGTIQTGITVTVRRKGESDVFFSGFYLTNESSY